MHQCWVCGEDCNCAEGEIKDTDCEHDCDELEEDDEDEDEEEAA